MNVKNGMNYDKVGSKTRPKSEVSDKSGKIEYL